MIRLDLMVAMQATVPPRIVAALTILITAAGILAFLGMFGWGIYKVWTKNPKPDSQAFVDVATALAALVGGIVAVGFNQPTTKPVTGHFSQNLAGLGYLLTAQSNWDWAAVLGGAYAIIYVVLGITAAVTWVAGPANPAPPLVKNLATTFIGLAVPIISSFFPRAPK
jgi:hypothetical protein